MITVTMWEQYVKDCTYSYKDREKFEVDYVYMIMFIFGSLITIPLDVITSPLQIILFCVGKFLESKYGKSKN